MLDKFKNNNVFDVKNCWDLIEILKEVKMKEDYRIASFYVEALFTNVPIKMVLEEIIENCNQIVDHSKGSKCLLKV